MAAGLNPRQAQREVVIRLAQVAVVPAVGAMFHIKLRAGVMAHGASGSGKEAAETDGAR